MRRPKPTPVADKVEAFLRDHPQATPKEIAAAVGTSDIYVYQYFRRKGIPVKPQLFRSEDVDISLAVMELHRQPHETFSMKQIARVCGLTWQGIWTIERRALKKIVGKLHRAGIHEARVPSFTPHRELGRQ